MSTPKSRPDPREVITTNALAVWIAAVAVYIVAITGRTSFGVAGVAALDRFHVDAAQIAVFTSVQVGVYALAQIPTGVLIDKVGPRKMLVVGAVVMGLGQLVLGLTSSYPVAIGARVFIGAGDATGFLSVMRILPYWFPLHRTPMFTQVTSSLGQIGQFISAVPFLWLLGVSGWSVAFVSLGAAGILIAIAAALAVADSPEAAGIYGTIPARTAARSGTGGIAKQLAGVIRSPIAWQAFFMHYTGLIVMPVFIMLWGVPMMTQAMGMSPTSAGLILTINTVCLVLFSPLHGRISQRLGRNRDLAVIGFAVFHLTAWGLFFAASTPRGAVAAGVMSAVMAMCFPTSNYGFDLVRENLDRSSVATATGLGNMGGFTGGMLAAQLAGVVLNRIAGPDGMEWADFRVAGAAVSALWAVGIVGIVLTRAACRRLGPSGPRITLETLPDDRSL